MAQFSHIRPALDRSQRIAYHRPIVNKQLLLTEDGMFGFLPGSVRGIVTFCLLVINFLFWLVPLLPFALVKVAFPINLVRQPLNVILNALCTFWAVGNELILKITTDIKWKIIGDDELSMKDWYLVLSNHQSWTDILVLQFVLNNRIPYFRFFLKQELIWLPIFNFIFIALDYPYMKRYSKEFIKKNPHLKGKDLETTKKSCERFKEIPVSVMNFVEGTRFSQKKHEKQKSPYKYLLNPRAGGIAFVLGAMGEYLTSILDVAISYNPKAMGIWDMLCGRIKEVQVTINKIPLSNDIIGNYFEDEDFKNRFQSWVNQLWLNKDQVLEGQRKQLISPEQP